jgi:hypothetical protein
VRLFLFLEGGAEAGFEVQGIGAREEGAVSWAEVQVVDLWLTWGQMALR